jgi:hypothetical protein
MEKTKCHAVRTKFHKSSQLVSIILLCDIQRGDSHSSLNVIMRETRNIVAC